MTPPTVAVQRVSAGTEVRLDGMPFVVRFVKGYQGDLIIHAEVLDRTLVVEVDGRLAVTAPVYDDDGYAKGHAVRADLDGVTYEIEVERVPAES
jgi:hypothetical protein